MQRARLPLLSLGLLLLVASQAHAAGFEVFPAGTRAAGRGGADFVGTDSPMALLYNPAQLAGLRRLRAAVSLQIHFADLCFDRLIVDAGERGPALGSTLPIGTQLPTVCNTGSPGPIPQLGFSLALGRGFTVGLGLFAPPAVRGVTFGTGKLRLDDADNTRNPARYGLLSQDLLQVFPTIGLGWEITPGFRIGVAMGFGITAIDTTTAAYGGSLIGDTKAHVTGSDSFVPRPSIGFHIAPGDLGLEFGGLFIYTQDVHATATFEISPEILGGNTPIGEIKNVALTSPQTWTAAFGVRYAHRLASPADEIGDRLSTERFDLEVDFMYVRSSRMDRIFLDMPDDAQILGLIDTPDEVEQPHNWKDQYVIRVGGDIAIVPGLFALRAGASHETNGVQRGFETIDFWNYSKTGIFLGATFRILKWVDFSVTYGHIFQETIVNDASTAQLRRAVSEEIDPDTGMPNADQPRTRWNAGVLRSNYDAIMIELGINLWRPLLNRNREEEGEDEEDDGEDQEEDLEDEDVEDEDEGDSFRRRRLTDEEPPPAEVEEEEEEEVETPPPPPPPADDDEVDDNPYTRPGPAPAPAPTPAPTPPPRRRAPDDDPNAIDWRRNY